MQAVSRSRLLARGLLPRLPLAWKIIQSTWSTCTQTLDLMGFARRNADCMAARATAGVSSPPPLELHLGHEASGHCSLLRRFLALALSPAGFSGMAAGAGGLKVAEPGKNFGHVCLESLQPGLVAVIL